MTVSIDQKEHIGKKQKDGTICYCTACESQEKEDTDSRSHKEFSEKPLDIIKYIFGRTTNLYSNLEY